MTFAVAVLTCLRKYVGFSGRAARAEYWYFLLFVLIAGMIANLLDYTFFAEKYRDQTTGRVVMTAANRPISALIGLVLFLPHFAAAWRRMHDTGRSGLYVLLPSIISLLALLVASFGLGLADMAASKLDSFLTGATLLLLIPLLILGVLSPLIVFWWLTRPSQPSPNSYGPNPHEVSP